MLNRLTPQSTATVIAAALLLIIIGAFIFEYAGYPPCELCLMQRWAYYVGIPFAGFMALGRPPWIKSGLIVLGLMLAANAVFGVYHSGVEWKWWEGPTACSGGAISDGLPDLSKPGVMCNEAAIRILGLSLAGWNALFCASLASLALNTIRNTKLNTYD
jgi:disulfide bond formation protein DsbB